MQEGIESKNKILEFHSTSCAWDTYYIIKNRIKNNCFKPIFKLINKNPMGKTKHYSESNRFNKENHRESEKRVISDKLEITSQTARS